MSNHFRQVIEYSDGFSADLMSDLMNSLMDAMTRHLPTPPLPSRERGGGEAEGAPRAQLGGGRGSGRALFRALLSSSLLCGALSHPACADSALTTLSRHHMAAPWVRFTSEGEALQAFAKQPVEDGGAAVLKVSTLTKAPAWLVRDLFSSENAEVISQWNAFTGDVQHLRDRVQYQAYKMPWPFLTRE